MPLPNVDDLLTPEEAAALLSVSPATLERWRAHRPIYGPAFIRISSRIIRYRQGDIRAFIEASLRQ
ncbi:helix-turn-helix transcriptional regulator [Novispirillum itersonii]|uniref:helix-turn-helix transcriptional regulator n=1 Tax=Novispirillum itersonii TaxID=189 RepID=UPI00037CE786|nr:helix-turn-helix domain-containing protein [Novispirillum itersonii]